MKLYELEKGMQFVLQGTEDSPVFTLEHIDGMYSSCIYKEEEETKVMHIVAFADVNIVLSEEPIKKE